MHLFVYQKSLLMVIISFYFVCCFVLFFKNMITTNTVFVVVIIILLLLLLIIQGKDDTKLNKEINGESQTELRAGQRRPSFERFLKLSPLGCSVCPPYLNGHIKITFLQKVD